MGILKTSLFAFTVGTAILAYCLYDPYMPDGVTGLLPYASSGIFRLSLFIGRTAGILGFEWNVVANSVLTAASQELTSLGVTYTNEVFGDGVSVKVYRPASDFKKDSKALKAGVVYFHGGGWCVGSTKMYDSVTVTVSHDLDAVVVSVEYRLAPRHQFPDAVTDSVGATEHFIRHAKDYGVDPNKIVVMGDSAGGNMATVVSSVLRDKKFSPMPRLQVLFYPVVQAVDLDTPSYRYNSHGPFLTLHHMGIFFSNYIFGNDDYVTAFTSNAHTSLKYKKELRGKHMRLAVLPDDDIKQSYETRAPVPEHGNIWKKHSEKFTDALISPLLADDVSGLPKTYILSCQYDVLRDDSFFYADRLRSANVKVKHVNLHACFHGWLKLVHKSAQEAGYLADVLTWIKDNL